MVNQKAATARPDLLINTSQVLLFSVVAMLPIWASGLSSRRAIVYSVLFVVLAYLVNFAKFQISSKLAGLSALTFGIILLLIERNSFLSLECYFYFLKFHFVY